MVCFHRIFLYLGIISYFWQNSSAEFFQHICKIIDDPQSKEQSSTLYELCRHLIIDGEQVIYWGKKDQWPYQWVKSCWFYTPLTVSGSCVWTLQQESLLSVSFFLDDNCILLGNVSQTRSVSGRCCFWLNEFEILMRN